MQGLVASTGVSLAAHGAPAPDAARKAVFPVREFGALGDGARLDTKSIQAAVDACAAVGGGNVYFAPGAYLSGTIFLKNGVALYLEAGATLLGSKRLEDYPVTVSKIRSFTGTYTDKSLIYGEGLSNIAILGRGVIDGQGAAFHGPYKVRPYMIRIIDCRGVLVADVTIRNSPMWVQHYLASDQIEIRNVTVHSLVNQNNDGIDIDGCQRVRISDCEIVSGDDAIVLKSTLNRPCRDIAVTNCVLSTRCNALKLGTESNGGFENIVVSNCTIYETNLAGIAVEMVDGGLLDRVLFNNIAIQKAGAPIFIRLGNRARPFEQNGPRPPVGVLRNVMISNIEAVASRGHGCSITGLAGHQAENITIENVRISFPGGGTTEDVSREVPENADKYPEFKMFGMLPAYGFYCRHVRNLKLRHIETRLEGRDARPALVCDDVQDLELSGSRFAVEDGVRAAVRFRDVRDAFVHGCRSKRRAAEWLEISGGKDSVAMQANNLG
jgi:polygalacturonase